MSDFESLGLRAGVWTARLHRAEAPARVMLACNGSPVAEADVQPEGPGGWRISVRVPVECLSDGLQTLVLLADQGDAEPGPGEMLGSLSLIAGAPAGDDLRGEIDLMRAELDLLQREFRRLARATAG
ncbi:hypothetical protein [Paracoccus jeotgali]|uniref:hypothetical protein n=1 Tax=Paracoccus jeotgali TaxID=2065379 RepID=UPI0028ADC7C3|nr:hypothetical protein [Paracoccus jeotgali]